MKNIVLIGFMGTGKTSTGRLLAHRLGRTFIDTDQKIEFDNNITVAEMFSIHGEQHFRQKESETIARISRYTDVVIATGGGVVLRPENLIRLKTNGVIIALTASLEVILERTSRRNCRPLLNRPDKEAVVSKLLKERADLYNKADLSIDTSDSTPQQVCDHIIAFLRQGGYLRGRC
ncbi:AAA family ATPase|uniref:Shikimate kinase n=1 Tax=Dendrosporobacter quercicolus TaxID=146817 RepID=A0A1G9LFD4_9FIRM|nr:shikimate kinase [Dendrosporobacter quercicolus]NSL46695.1 AAA family ATPase [Dendrosporobacter quercicolus DSM 1736]SDL60648.1 shikimate kinase [Dendrosporobacter quercicolus]